MTRPTDDSSKLTEPPRNTSDLGATPDGFVTDPTVTFQRNRTIGQYELLRQIGKGGGGQVFEAVHILLKKRVALKLLTSENIGDKNSERRFFQEIESIGRLHHPHIVQAFDAGQSDGIVYLAMEFVEGSNIEILAKRCGQLSVADASEIVRQAALGLQHIHEHGLIHRDIKPANLLISVDGVKIVDLGLAVLSHLKPNDERLTGSYIIMGTFDYMSPEQAQSSHDLDIRADLYSLGCTFYRLLAGRAPYSGPEHNTTMKKILAHAADPFPDLRHCRSDVPAEILSILERLVAKERAERYSEPQELVDALQPYCAAADLRALVRGDSTQQMVETRFENRSEDSLSTESASAPTRLLPHTTKARTNQRAFLALAILGCVALAASAMKILKTTAPSHSGTTASTANTNTISAKPDPAVPHIDDTQIVDKKPPETPVAPPILIPAPPRPIPPLGPIAQRWEKEFGRLPTELEWPGKSGQGTWKLDEDLRSLVIDTHNTIRFVKLGELDNDLSNVIHLGADFVRRSNVGTFGFFFGYRPEVDDVPRYAHYHSVEIWPPVGGDDPAQILVRRFYGKFDSNQVSVLALANRHQRLVVPRDGKLRIRIKVEHGRPQSIQVFDQQCTDLTSDRTHTTFGPVDFSGPFGIYASDCTIWVTNPVYSSIGIDNED